MTIILVFKPVFLFRFCSLQLLILTPKSGRGLGELCPAKRHRSYFIFMNMPVALLFTIERPPCQAGIIFEINDFEWRSKPGWVDNCRRWMKTNDGQAFIALASTFNSHPPHTKAFDFWGRPEDYEDFVAPIPGESKLNNRQTVKGNLRNKAFRDLPQEITKLLLCPVHISVLHSAPFHVVAVFAIVWPYLLIFEYLISFCSSSVVCLPEYSVQFLIKQIQRAAACGEHGRRN